MNATIQSVDSTKILEAIMYVATKVQEPTFHKISKMFWYADRLHLQQYGYPLSDDTYHAMENGPVPSFIYDMMKLGAGKKQAMPNVDTGVVREAIGVKSDGMTVIVKRDPNLDYLSEAEVECLNMAISEHGYKSYKQLSIETHDSAWHSVDLNAAIPFNEIVKTLPNAEELQSFLYA